MPAVIALMRSRGRCGINPRKFQNDMTTMRTKDDVLSLLVHLGYLAYDRQKQEVYIPNQEIASEFLNAVEEPAWDGILQPIVESKALVEATVNLEENTVAAGMDTIHMRTASLLKYNDENSLACSVYIAYYIPHSQDESKLF